MEPRSESHLMVKKSENDSDRAVGEKQKSSFELHRLDLQKQKSIVYEL